MRLIPFGGFLGAGKTTTMLAAARWLESAGERVAVITNDQGTDLVDTQLARLAGPGAVAEVTGGCFCCRFDDLAATIKLLREQVDPTVILAEAVGSCTDLQSTVVRPLRHFYGAEIAVAPLTVVLDPLVYRETSARWLPLADEPDIAYLYRHQLDEANIIAVNKSDLVDDAEPLCTQLRAQFRAATVLPISAKTGAGIAELLELWTGSAEDRHAFDVNYDRYGAAEAELAWTNQTFTVTAPAGATFAPAGWVDRLLAEFARASAESSAMIGHVKVFAETGAGITKASLTGGSAPPTFDRRVERKADRAAVTVNARVRIDPAGLDALIDRAVAVADQDGPALSGDRSGRVFRPGFPVPVHRM
jgi:G3E family GTPase